MMKLSDIRISGKLYGLIAIALVGMAGLASVGYYQIERVFAYASYGAMNTAPSLATLDELRKHYLRTRLQIARHILSTNPAEKIAIEGLIRANRDGVAKALAKYEPLISDDMDRGFIKKTEKLWREYDSSLDLIIAESHANHADVARSLMEQGVPQAEKIGGTINEHFDYNVELGHDGVKQANAQKQDAIVLSAAIAGAVMAVLGMLGWLIANRWLARPIGEVVNDLKMLAEGKLDVAIAGIERRDEVGDIARAAQVFKEFAQQLNTQGWIKSQVAELSGAMQVADTPRAFAQVVIDRVSPLLECGAAAFYVWQPEIVSLTLMGSWGALEGHGLTAAYRLGEGLVGECARQRSPILLADLPEDYFRISSALGEAAPRVVLVTPIMAKGEVVGVIEFAAFTRFSEAQQALLDELMPVVALNLEIIDRNMKTRELLQETREQAEKLLASEEELRMQSEELMAANEEMRATEEELRAQGEEQVAINEELSEKSIALEAAQAESNRRAAELEAASRYKSDFLANMSHELRTPLNSLLILARSLAENEENNLTPDQIESANIIHDGGRHLLHLINDILDLSKVEAGKMTVAEADVDLSAFALGIRRNFSALAKSQSLSLTVDVAPEVPLLMRGDAGKMEQIVTNLVGNAFKFTRQGGVTVRLSLLAGKSQGDQLSIAVEDTGVGIPADKLEQIFGAFEQVDGTSSRQFGGTGLGLTISRRLAELLGGEIAVTSVEGQGSTFTLTLPLRQAQVTTAAASLASEPMALPDSTFADDRATLAPGDKVILVVEDDEVFARIECELARKRGFKCLRAADGRSALQLAEQYHPLGILLDIGLPDLDGWTVMTMLKESPVTRDIPVRIISGLEDGERALAMGAVSHLKKPVDKSQLNDVFDRLGQAAGNGLRRVLIVDDDVASRKAITTLVQDDRVELFEARDGNSALEMLQSDRFDCVILDLNLPDFSGFELLERATQQGVALPAVVVYTAKDLSFEENLALREYTDSIVVKGERSPERLADEVSLFLHSMYSSLTFREQPALGAGSTRAIGLDGVTVLVVDDDMRNAFALSKVLRSKGLSVLLAQDGYKALAQLEENDDIEMVLMDIMMPGMDDYDTIREIRKQPRFETLPIVALTAKAMPGDREKCLAVGANDYFSKPVDIDRLLPAMSTLVRQQD